VHRVREITDIASMETTAPPDGAESLPIILSSRYTISDVESVFERIRDLKVLVVGEAIVDEYLYCETIGKSGKEPILAARYVSLEQFAGGVLAVANHIATLSDSVTVLTFLGEIDSHEELIRRQMDPKVRLQFLTVPGAPTILKRRYVEVYPFQKLFELYVMDGDEYAAQSDALCSALEATLADYDVVIVVDYGHGMIGPDAVSTLCSGSRFLAVNTQTNADNRGFNTISKYPRADYVSVSETEIRLEERRRHGELHEILVAVAERLSCPRIVVTRGSKGCLCYDRAEGFAEVPAFTSSIVDRVGAGDAVLAITALCAVQGVSPDLLGGVAGAVGAQAVGIVGNRAAIDPAKVLTDIAARLPV
jgi:bifunctional ADP-heptose synthase (sugar kinase/adenylyltransferase)